MNNTKILMDFFEIFETLLEHCSTTDAKYMNKEKKKVGVRWASVVFKN